MPLKQVNFSNEALVNKSRDEELSSEPISQNKKVSVSTQSKALEEALTPWQNQTHYKFFSPKKAIDKKKNGFEKNPKNNFFKFTHYYQ